MLLIDAGQLPDDNRQRGADEGQGRILGEACGEAVIAGGPPPVEEAQLVNSSPATLAAPESQAKGARTTLESL